MSRVLETKITNSNKLGVVCEITFENGRGCWLYQHMFIDDWSVLEILVVDRDNRQLGYREILHDPTMTEINKTIDEMLERISQ